MTFQHYIWDFDGTLFDSYPHITRAFQKALRKYGLTIAAEEILPWVKLSLGKAVHHFKEQYGLDDRIWKIYDACEAEEDDTAPVVPYNGVKQVCHEIYKHGYHNYLYTHRGDSALTYLNHYGLSPYFRDFITSKDESPSKPALDAILHLINKFQIEPSTAVMIGDREIDVLAGTNAGIHGCLFDPDGFFREFKAEYLVENMQEFMETFLVPASVIREDSWAKME